VGPTCRRSLGAFGSGQTTTSHHQLQLLRVVKILIYCFNIYLVVQMTIDLYSNIKTQHVGVRPPHDIAIKNFSRRPRKSQRTFVPPLHSGTVAL
jgi:hypothetical protein